MQDYDIPYFLTGLIPGINSEHNELGHHLLLLITRTAAGLDARP